VEGVVARSGESFGFGQADPVSAVDRPLGAVCLDDPGGADLGAGWPVLPLPVEDPSGPHDRIMAAGPGRQTPALLADIFFTKRRDATSIRHAIRGRTGVPAQAGRGRL